jgi:hypothetical protein
MTDAFGAGDAVIFMKIGTHANEDLGDIIERKKREIREAGYSMWGYGGNTCHPTSIVQPFARNHAASNHPIRLCMHPMESRHFAVPVRAEQYSVDGVEWESIPSSINVLGSRYALCITGLREADAQLQLINTRVAIGNSTGRIGADYVRGHVDKACLEVVSPGDASEGIQIGFVADVVEPYAVFLRN